VRVAVIGAGSIGAYLFERLLEDGWGGIELVGIADVPNAQARLRELAGRAGCAWTTEPLDLIQQQPDVVIEAASQEAVRRYAVPLLERGVDLLLMSVGALVDGDVLHDVGETARRSGRRVIVPAGAIGGLDVLRAAREGDLREVTLRTSKPPAGLAGAPFFDEQPMELAGLTERTVVFRGTAREAVRLFPANVNVAAAISLAGLGPDRTTMEVVADPGSDRNVHEVIARGDFGEVEMRFTNVPSPANPRTSYLACLSPLAALRRLDESIQLG
jgi:aspartate dehydrogenase